MAQRPPMHYVAAPGGVPPPSGIVGQVMPPGGYPPPQPMPPSQQGPPKRHPLGPPQHPQVVRMALPPGGYPPPPQGVMIAQPGVNYAPSPQGPIHRPPNMPQGPPGGIKRPMPGNMPPPPPNTVAPSASAGPPKKKKKITDKLLPEKIRDLVPESQAYQDLLFFEKKLDFTIMRKRLDIQEALKKPLKVKRKLRIFVSNTFFSGKPGDQGTEGAPPGEIGEPNVPSWELRVEGRLLDDKMVPEQGKTGKRKFSSYFKSLVIELDKNLYGPDNHLVEWHRSAQTSETDGFQVKRPGDKNVRCTILLLLDHNPMQYKPEQHLGRLLGLTSATRNQVIHTLWQYIKQHQLQDTHEREFINCDRYLEQIFNTPRMKFVELPARLNQLLMAPDPVMINHMINVESGEPGKKTTCYDIDVEIEDPLKQQMSNFLMSTASQNEIMSFDQKIHETVDSINQLKVHREFYLGFAADPQKFVHSWLLSQVRDLKIMTDQAGNPEEERLSEFFYQPWTNEGVFRYFYNKVQQRRTELEQVLGIRNN